MIRITKWKPDTCGCVINLEWDDEVSSENRTHSLNSIEKCEFHQALSDADAHAAVLDENVTKNQVLGIVHADHSDLVDSKPDGSVALKSEYEYVWSFDENRKLQAEITGIDDVKSDSIKASIDAELGSGKVEVVKGGK